MPRFHYDLDADGQSLVDEKGSETVDVHIAHQHAVKTIADASGTAPEDGQPHAYALRMRDESGKVVFERSVSVTARWME